MTLLTILSWILIILLFRKWPTRSEGLALSFLAMCLNLYVIVTPS